MNLQRIEQLLNKFEQGESSLEEELELKIFFAKENVPAHLAGYKDLFSFFRHAAEERMEAPGFDKRVLDRISGTGNEVSQSRRITRKLYPFMAVAATLLIMFGIYMFLLNQQSPRDTFDDPALAYEETRKVLLQVSDNLNEGVDELSNIGEMNSGLENLNSLKTFDEGMKNMQKISILDKSKDIITQKNK